MGVPRIYYDNRLRDAAPSASSTMAGYDVLNLRDFRPYTWWQAETLPATVSVDCGSAQAVNYWGLYGHNLATYGCTIQLRGSTDNFVSSDVLVDSCTPSTNSPFIRTIGSTSYRYWRQRITGASPPKVAIALMGASLDLPVYMEEGFDPTMRNPEGIYNRSVKGHPLGRVTEYEEWAAQLKFGLVSWSWVRQSWTPAWTTWLRDNPFLFAWDLDSYPAEVFLLVAKDKFTSPHKPGSYADLNVDVVGVWPVDLPLTVPVVPYTRTPYRVIAAWQDKVWTAPQRRPTAPI